MNRAREVASDAALWAALAAAVLWWAPVILLWLAQLAAGRARFALVMTWGDALKATGRRESAVRLYEREVEQCRARRAAAIRARRRC